MLREGQLLKDQGIDVVICAVSTIQRPETARQIGGLERVSSIRWQKDGVEKKDLNLEALTARNPEVVLVDGLAHRNREGALYPTRLEDIRHLLGKGISVITTVNVYELEGATELAQKLTGIEVRETVPSDTLELADEVVLVDATPETILSRVEEGSVKVQKGTGVFKRGNLAVLRELALRLVAEGVNDSLERHREEDRTVGRGRAHSRIRAISLERLDLCAAGPADRQAAERRPAGGRFCQSEEGVVQRRGGIQALNGQAGGEGWRGVRRAAV